LLGEIPRVTVHDIGKRRCGIVTFSVAGVSANDVETRLRENKVHVSVTTPASTLIDARHRQLPEMVRASVHCFNEESELARCAELVKDIAASPG
jgi:selenocysteine lyase/cysteine desulfurase